MSDLMNVVMWVCAVVGSMAFGVLAAYGIFRVGFALMRRERRSAALQPRSQTAKVL